VNAHSVSLPIFNAMQMLEGKTASEALSSISCIIRCLQLTSDIQPVVIILRSSTCIDLQPETPRGLEVLDEVKVRSEFLPCPEEECEYDSSGCCRWCGKLR
jgi:hypothetical protein